jgi:SAM-dependent methyltransferase
MASFDRTRQTFKAEPAWLFVLPAVFFDADATLRLDPAIGLPSRMRHLLMSRLRQRIAARLRTSANAQRSTFTAIFQANAWGNTESVSGPGSTLSRGADFQQDLMDLLSGRNIRSVLDAPCGDFNWMRNVLERRDLIYTGVDIVEALIARNSSLHRTANRRFLCTDMTRADLPAADLIICRDGLVHLSFTDARAAIRNFRRSGSRFVLATTFVDRSQNSDVPTGGWRVLNLARAPFHFPAPLALIDERCTHSAGIYRDKRLGLWELASLDR